MPHERATRRGGHCSHSSLAGPVHALAVPSSSASTRRADTIVKEGEHAVAFFVLSKGKVEVTKGAGRRNRS